jgi:hypothetical protein
MVIDPSIGVEKATRIATDHEGESGNPEDEKAMDLENNAIGRSIGLTWGDYDLAFDDCHGRAQRGELVLIDFSEDGPF